MLIYQSLPEGKSWRLDEASTSGPSYDTLYRCGGLQLQGQKQVPFHGGKPLRKGTCFDS